MKYRLLMIDDEELIRKGFLARLQYLNLEFEEILEASSGKEALLLLEKKSVDIVVTDIHMPDMDGLTVCRSIRDFVSCPILFLTAKIEDGDKIKGFRAGGDDYIVKPFSIDELGARVEAHLRRDSGQIFDKERIYEKIWGFDGQGDSSVVAEHVRRIRSKMAAMGCKPYIETVWGVGYKWSR